MLNTYCPRNIDRNSRIAAEAFGSRLNGSFSVGQYGLLAGSVWLVTNF
jgi:hypothetical protein